MKCIRLKPWMGIALATALLSAPACKKNPSAHSTTPPPVKAPATSSNPPSDELSQKIEALTGAPTRAVWSHHTGTGSADPFCSGTSHQLHGIDTRDGRGLRVLLAAKNNYSRPLITPDGERILFTRKLVTRPKEDDATKIFDMTIMVTDWTGSEPRPLIAGYALDVWQDPATGQSWVYAAQDIPPTHRIAWAANRLIRFPLDAPDRLETVWDQTPISPDNTQLSADGTRASAQTPWPNGGQFLLAPDATRFESTFIGCWASLAPDNSYLSWMLDGSHRVANVTTLAPVKKSWRLKFNDLPGLEKSEIYHPRWSNHPRFITLTGPYLAETKPGEGSIISKGGRTAEVVIAKLNATANGFDGSVTLTANSTTDAYPDVWIAGAEGATLGDFPQGLAAATAATDWPAQKDRLLFLWEALGQPNQIQLPDGKTLECHLEPKGTALFGPRLDMQLATGAFVPSALSRAPLEKALPQAPSWTLEAVLLPPSLPAPGAALTGDLLTLPGWHLALAEGVLTINGQALTHPPLSLPCHLALRRDGPNLTAFLNGLPLPAVEISPQPTHATTQFGGGTPLSASLLGLALYDTALNDSTLAASHLHWEKRWPTLLTKNPPRVRLRGKLVETTGLPTPESIDPYTRAMVSYVYEVEQVLEGDYDGQQILVCHWSLMDLKPCAGLPRQHGQSYDLLVEPLDIDTHHPELKGQRVLDDTTAFDLEKWYDITPPQAQ